VQTHEGHARSIAAPGVDEPEADVDRGHARSAYDVFAAHYDAFTAHHDYDAWTATLEQLARDCGLRGRHLLDVACGTGKSFLPFLRRGYDVTACDVSEPMVRIAEAKAGGEARLEVHDMRSLPALGAFDLVCCLDDAVNYLLTTEELRDAFAGLRRNLAADGVVLFDVNSVWTYRTFYASISVVPGEDRVLVWEGHASPSFAESERADATLEILERAPDGTWPRRRSVHHQRHHPRAAIEAALLSAGLECVGLHGMYLDGSVSDEFREHENSKAVYIARRRAPEGERR
jgi:SAM-dependent methyltransferase